MSSAEKHILKRLEKVDCIRPSDLFADVDYSGDTFSEKQVWKAIQRMTARGDLVLGPDNRLRPTDEPEEQWITRRKQER